MSLLNRRALLQLTGAASALGFSWSRRTRLEAQSSGGGAGAYAHAAHLSGPVGRVSLDAFNPSVFLRSWNFSDHSAAERGRYYRETPRPDGSLLREYDLVAVDREIEIAPGVFFPAWTFNGQVPGPTLRATEGDRVRVNFLNQGSHPHTIHFHGWHPPEMDGSLPEHQVMPGDRFVYEFDAEPFGLHLYHCHAVPLKRHIHKGLYGVFIVDPRPARPEADELIMVMNGFDTNFDADNEVYAVNTVANFFLNEPIKVEVASWFACMSSTSPSST